MSPSHLLALLFALLPLTIGCSIDDGERCIEGYSYVPEARACRPIPDAGAPQPDAKAPEADGKAPEPDGKAPEPDVKATAPDAAPDANADGPIDHAPDAAPVDAVPADGLVNAPADASTQDSAVIDA